MDLHILSGGAAQGVVKSLWQSFSAETGAELKGSFGAVGLMKEKLLAGEACDVVILTAALVDGLIKSGHAVAGSKTPLGRVKTGVAVRAGESMPDVSTAAGLKAALLAARGIYFPDPEKATAGIHFVNVLKQLGIYGDVEKNLRPFPNGATAMRSMAEAKDPGVIGCTQVTEILYTDGVRLVDVLPKEFELATVYTAAVCSKAAEPELARKLVRLLGAEKSRDMRVKGGFEL
jgi:molybdate transport system substrate-binding protein